jgi:diacylglycerol kinase (ATP)
MINKFDASTILDHEYHPLRKIKVVWSGFWFLMRNDFSVTYKVVISILVLALAIWFRQYTNVMLILISTGNMLGMEIMNTCVELLCDFHVTEYNAKIKVIKDVSAVAAGISILVWLSVIIFELIEGAILLL